MNMAGKLIAIFVFIAFATAAAAQIGGRSDWSDVLKPYVVKSNPTDPNAAPPPANSGDQQPTGPVHPVPLGPQLGSAGKSLLDGCVITAIGRLPKADGMKIVDSSYQYRDGFRQFEFYRVFVTVDLAGRRASYHWLCRIYANSSAELLPGR